jgi:acetyltransferase-like isoleucine patch superfamily enzyme
MALGNPIKRAFKKIIKRIYLAGFHENMNDERAARKISFKKNATFDDTTYLEDTCTIFNPENDSSKITIGKNSIVKGELLLFSHGGNIKIGDYCHIGDHSRIWSAKNIIIGDRVLIAHNVNIHDNISHPLDSAERHTDFKHILSIGLQKNIDLREAEIIIEDDVWIGFNTTILKGTRIGKGAIIGANCLITENVPPYAIVINKVNTEIIRYTT